MNGYFIWGHCPSFSEFNSWPLEFCVAR
jgi:hypothetical protein